MPSGRHQQQQVSSGAQPTVKDKQRLCTNCKNHGLRKVWKKHKRYCKYRDCPCAKCMKTAATRKNCAEQTAKRRARQEDEQREQELQLNPANFLDERPIPYPGPMLMQQQQQPDTACTSSVSTFRSIRQLSVSSLAAASSTTKASSSRTSDYDENSSIDIGGSGTGVGMAVEREAEGSDGLEAGVDIDADSKPGMMNDQIEDVKTILKELIGRTKDFQSLNAFRLFVLQHNTYDVDKAAKLIKRGVRSKLLNRIKFTFGMFLSVTRSYLIKRIAFNYLLQSHAANIEIRTRSNIKYQSLYIVNNHTQFHFFVLFFFFFFYANGTFVCAARRFENNLKGRHKRWLLGTKNETKNENLLTFNLNR